MRLKWTYLFIGCFSAAGIYGQTLPSKLQKAVNSLENNIAFRHAILGLSVMDTKTGKLVYEHNGEKGLAAASVQKIITSSTALDLLGPDFRFSTQIMIDQGQEGALRIVGDGDPSLGSWRFASTRPDLILNQLLMKLRARPYKVNKLLIDDSAYPDNGIPRGWIWEDIGNYYGAGVWGLNWKENQYDLWMEPGQAPGDPVKAVHYDNAWFDGPLRIQDLVTGAVGSGDNAYIFPSVNGNPAILSGTIPPGKPFSISGSSQSPYRLLQKELIGLLDSARLLARSPQQIQSASEHITRGSVKPGNENIQPVLLCSWQSPALDSLNYFFLRRSINLYGEALLRALAKHVKGDASPEKGLDLLDTFWKSKGVNPGSFQLMDGSGLSPQNRVTTNGLLKVLTYARSRLWFNYFYDALPVYNGMKMKSGSIGGARAFAGYHKAADGHTYSFAIIINNYRGSSSAAVKALYQVLDQLK